MTQAAAVAQSSEGAVGRIREIMPREAWAAIEPALPRIREIFSAHLESIANRAEEGEFRRSGKT